MKRRSFLKGLLFSVMMPIAVAVGVELIPRRRLTLREHASNHDVARIIEMLSQQNPILEDMAWKEGYLDKSNYITERTSIPLDFIEMAGKISRSPESIILMSTALITPEIDWFRLEVEDETIK